MNMIFSLLWFIIIFSVVVVSHEFGHFIVAKANGIRVKEFMVGFGPSIIKFKKGDTTYKINVLPFFIFLLRVKVKLSVVAFQSITIKISFSKIFSTYTLDG